MAAVELRLATPDDIPALEQLIPLSVRTLQAATYTPEQIEAALGTVFGVDRQLIRDRTYFVAEAEGRIVGCGGWSRRKTLFGSDHGPVKDDAWLDPASEAARVRAFFVHPAWARRGIGRNLLDACEAAAREAGFARLELAATLAGEPLYAGCGFSVVAQEDAPLPTGGTLPIVRMQKLLHEGSWSAPGAAR
jgi:GNAT superfamily N-acetyltransferase